MTDLEGPAENSKGGSLKAASKPMHLVVDMGLSQGDPREGEASKTCL